MKLNALGWLVVVALTGCGLGGTNPQSSNSSKLTGGDAGADPGKGTAGGWGGPEGCSVPCEAEQVAYKQCVVTPGPGCQLLLETMNQCLAHLPPSPPAPCEAEAIALKGCDVNSPGTCTGLAQAFAACNAQPPPLGPPDPNPKDHPGTGCSIPPPPPCGGGGGPAPVDKCQDLQELYKLCTVQTPNAQCAALLQAFTQCQAGQQSPPPPGKP